MNEIIIGLGGHIDHGKTSLIKSLTNEFSGSLKEDLKRGMTIDLGIAFLNKNITIIDVPGHEDFVKNMMSGIHGVDIGLLVIAADDGIMPQTIEHFNIFRLLGISKLVIVINKIDLVEDELLEIIKLEIFELLENTKFENTSIFNISATGNKGINKLKKSLLDIVDSCPKKHNKGPFRLPIDRVFSIKGFGTVVTGTVMSGEINIGDELNIQPINTTVKIRGLNTHNASTNKVSVGQRAAINIQNIDKNKIKRGFQIVNKFFFYKTESIIAKIQLLDHTDKIIKKNQRIRIHLGTSEVIGKIFLFNEKIIKAGQKSIVLINLETPIVACYKDKFIIRYYSPLSTLGGGEVLFTATKKNNFINEKSMKLGEVSNLINNFNNVEDDDYIKIIIESYYKNPIFLNSFCYQIGYSESQLLELLKYDDDIIIINYLNKKWLLTNKQFDLLKNIIMKFILDFFNKNSYSININKELISGQLNMKIDFIDYLLFYLAEQNKIIKKNNGWIISNYKITLDDKEKTLKIMIVKILEKEQFNTSSIDELLIKCNIKDFKLLLKIIKLCESEKLLIRINQGIFITNKNILLLKTKLQNFFKNNPSLKVSDLKDLIGVSRKYAIPILEYLDKIQFTYRDANERKLVS